MTSQEDHPPTSAMYAPLRLPVFRRIWIASLLSNFGQLILGVGAAWEMTRLTNSPNMVALVQTAIMLPLMLVAVPAGAFADMFDRRKIAMLGLAMASVAGVCLTTLSYLGLTTPWLLLAFCSIIGIGVAIYGPSWQASIGEQVPKEQLPSAVALGTISYNVARSFGPALGGLIVLAAGAQAAFALNAFFYLPLLVTFFIWKRASTATRLPPERLDRAIISGVRYALHASAIRTVVIRTFLLGLTSATATALAPLIARDILGGNASTFGLLLGAGGVGAVAGAMLMGRIQADRTNEAIVRLLTVIGGLALICIAFSTSLILTGLMFAISGAANIMIISLLNVSVQIGAPRWVTARALSLFQSALTGGIAIGALIFGLVATHWSIEIALLSSGLALTATAIAGYLLPLPQEEDHHVEKVHIGNEVDVALNLSLRSGPIVISIDYRIDPANAREFYDAMRGVQRARLRNGGFNWSLARDIAHPEVWTERYQCPTWGDYLRVRDRYTQADQEAQTIANAYLIPGASMIVRRRLERPYGSVRWRADTPDLGRDETGYNSP